MRLNVLAQHTVHATLPPLASGFEIRHNPAAMHFAVASLKSATLGIADALDHVDFQERTEPEGY